jgi:hypothetical protein
MISSLVIKLKQFLIKLVYFCESKNVLTEKQRRIDVVGDCIYNDLPLLVLNTKQNKVAVFNQIENTVENLNVIEGGKFNYFEISNNNIPKFDFVCPEIPLYVVVGGPETASKQTALNLGISNEHWERASLDIETIKKCLPLCGTLGIATKPKLVIFNWDDPVNKASVVSKLEEALNEA